MKLDRVSGLYFSDGKVIVRGTAGGRNYVISHDAITGDIISETPEPFYNGRERVYVTKCVPLFMKRKRYGI